MQVACVSSYNPKRLTETVKAKYTVHKAAELFCKVRAQKKEKRKIIFFKAGKTHNTLAASVNRMRKHTHIVTVTDIYSIQYSQYENMIILTLMKLCIYEDI